MAREVHTLTLSASDWGKVVVALDHELNRARNEADGKGLGLELRLKLAIRVGILTRIRSEIKRQRQSIRYGHVTDQSVIKS